LEQPLRLLKMLRADINPFKVFAGRSAGEFCITHFAQASLLKVGRHFHQDATLCVLLRGAAKDTFLSKTVEYHPGGVIFRPPHEVHSHQYGSSGAVALVIEVPSGWLRAHTSLRSLSEVRFGQLAPALVDSAQLIGQLRDDNVSEPELEESCLVLLSLFEPETLCACDSEGVGRIRALLEDDFVQNHSLAELSRIASLHPAYLVNAFRKRYGCSIGQFRRRRRVAFSLNKLWNTDAPISEVALESGFYDQSHCANEIRRHTRQTPAQLRRLINAHL
jgi:AraC family transcriptional regulator